MSEHRDLESTAAFIHGVAFCCNLIGVMYNLRRRHWIPFFGNLFGAAFHVAALIYHLNDLWRKDEKARADSHPPR